jgi:hypothetical protein
MDTIDLLDLFLRAAGPRAPAPGPVGAPGALPGVPATAAGRPAVRAGSATRDRCRLDGVNRATGRVLPFLLLLPAILASADPAAAQGARVSGTAVEDLQAGYSMRPLLGWEAAPRKNPGDPTAANEVGGWYPRGTAQARRGDGPSGAKCIVLAFGSLFPVVKRVAVATESGGTAPAEPGDDAGDAAKPGDGGAGEGGEGEEAGEGKKPRPPQSVEELFGTPPADFDEWLSRNAKAWKARGMDLNATGSETLKLGGDPARLLSYSLVLSHGRQGAGTEVARLQAAAVRRDGYELAAVYMAPPADWEAAAFKTSLKSLELLSRPRLEAMRRKRDKVADQAADDQERWLAEVKSRIPPGWGHRRTKNYLIVYDKSLETQAWLLSRIERQLEGIRAQVYEKMFPAERPVQTVSVVKITQDPEQYRAYGAPAGSAGYWSWPSRELVFFWHAKDGDLTLDVLNHEAFHQYIFYSVGMVSPHSWFNEGHGDYFAGFEFVQGKFLEAKFGRRSQAIRSAIEGRYHVPLDKFLTFSQAEYYRRGGERKEGGDALQNYAQGWSLVWFLRTTRKPEYQGVLQRYFDTLKGEVAAWRAAEEEAAAKENRKPLEAFLTPEEVHEAARAKALQAAFGGVDLKALERDWIDSKPW